DVVQRTQLVVRSPLPPIAYLQRDLSERFFAHGVSSRWRCPILTARRILEPDRADAEPGRCREIHFEVVADPTRQLDLAWRPWERSPTRGRRSFPSLDRSTGRRATMPTLPPKATLNRRQFLGHAGAAVLVGGLGRVSAAAAAESYPDWIPV